MDILNYKFYTDHFSTAESFQNSARKATDNMT